MSRGLDTSQTAAASAVAVSPYYLVQLGFASVVYLSSRGDISWSSHSWLDADIDIKWSDYPTVTIFNEGGSLGATVLSNGTGGRSIQIYAGFANDAGHPDPVMIFDGEMGEATVGTNITIRCKRNPPITTPRFYTSPPTFNHVPRQGTVFETSKEVVRLTTRRFPPGWEVY